MPVMLLGGNRNEPGGYSPTSWFAANKETSYVDNDTLTTITDFGSKGNTLNAVSGTPKYRTNIVNGYPVFRGDGASDISRANITATGLFAAGAGTAIMVARATTLDVGFGWLLAETGVASKAYIEMDTGATQNSLAWNNDGAADATATKTMTTNTWYILTWHHEGGNLYHGSNDTRTSSMASVASGNTTLAAGDDLFLFGSGGANFFTGDIAEVIFFDTALTEAQRQEWELWFGFKYGITLPY